MSLTKKLRIDDIIYIANIDFRTAIRCNEIAQDDTIGNYERVLGIICTMFGEEAIDNIKKYPKHTELLLKWCLNYLSCGQEIEDKQEQPDMDYVEDMPYIEASFMSDFHIDLEKENMTWHKFNKLMNGLSNSDMGNCCVLNRVRNLRNMDLSKIKDSKERQNLEEAKERVTLKKYKKENNLNQEQEESMRRLDELLGL